VHQWADLSSRIEGVKKTFTDNQEDERWLPEVSEEPKRRERQTDADQEARAWVAVKNEDGYIKYETPQTIHIFLLNDNAVSEEPQFDPQEYNKKALAALRTLIHPDPPKHINLIDSVLKEGQILLKKYIGGWGQYRLRLKKELLPEDPEWELPHTIFPAKITGTKEEEPAPTEPTNGNMIKKEKQVNWELPDTAEYPEGFWFTPFAMPTMRFTDTGVISGSYHELPCEMYYNTQFIFFEIETPGFNDSHRHRDFIDVETDIDKKHFSVFINLDERRIPKDCTRAQDGFKKGSGFAEFDLEPFKIRYGLPKSRAEWYGDMVMKIVDGVLKITLPRDDLIGA